jgi:hypothetical protein
MCTNLILLPAILLSLNSKLMKEESLAKPFIELEDEEEKEG